MDEMPALERLRPRQAERCIVERQPGETPVYILKDAGGCRYMRLSEEGLFVWQLMDGKRTIGDLCGAYVRRFGRPAPDEVLRALGRWLEAGFVRFQDVDAGARPTPAAAPRAHTLRPLLSLCTRYWWLSGLDRKVMALYRGLRVLYTVPAQAAVLAVVCAGAIAFAGHLAGGSWASWQRSLPVWLASLALHVVVHEAAHAATCKHFGRQVNRAGIGWYFLAPVAFVDTSDIWAAARLPRILVSAAGPYSNLALSGVAALAALAAPAHWQDVLWSFGLTGYALALVNLNPLLELDGYYIVMDLLEIPNLRARALAYLGSRPGGRAAPEPRLRRIFMLFGAASLAYGIAIGVGLMSVYRAHIVDIAGSYLARPYAQAIGWVLAGTMSFIILHRLLDGLRLGRRG